MRGAPTFQEVTVVVNALPPAGATPEQVETLCAALSSFVAANERPDSSAHLRATVPDRLEALVGLLGRPEIGRSADACVLVLKASLCAHICARSGQAERRGMGSPTGCEVSQRALALARPLPPTCRR